MVPNFGISWDSNSRRGRMVNPRSKSCHAEKTKSMRDQTLGIHGGKMFNLLPVEIRNFTGPKEEFKIILDNFPQLIPDEPFAPGLTPSPVSRVTCKNSNSIIDWVYHLDIVDR